jgi:hypothetical protein
VNGGFAPGAIDRDHLESSFLGGLRANLPACP